MRRDPSREFVSGASKVLLPPEIANALLCLDAEICPFDRSRAFLSSKVERANGL